jgi:hypothetical protein
MASHSFLVLHKTFVLLNIVGSFVSYGFV